MMATTDNALNTANWEYQTQNVIMVPYRETGNKFFPETFMVSLYQRMQQQDLVNLIFPGMGITHLHKFIAFVNTHPFVIGFCAIRQPGRFWTRPVSATSPNRTAWTARARRLRFRLLQRVARKQRSASAGMVLSSVLDEEPED